MRMKGWMDRDFGNVCAYVFVWQQTGFSVFYRGVTVEAAACTLSPPFNSFSPSSNTAHLLKLNRSQRACLSAWRTLSRLSWGFQLQLQCNNERGEEMRAEDRREEKRRGDRFYIGWEKKKKSGRRKWDKRGELKQKRWEVEEDIEERSRKERRAYVRIKKVKRREIE